MEVSEACGVSMVQGYALGRPQTVPANFESFEAADGSALREVLEDDVVSEVSAESGARRRVFGRRVRRQR
ncbi:MAG: hypothetical protein QM744_15080 [Mesorhizobium sp.]